MYVIPGNGMLSTVYVTPVCPAQTPAGPLITEGVGGAVALNEVAVVPVNKNSLLVPPIIFVKVKMVPDGDADPVTVETELSFRLDNRISEGVYTN